MEFHRLDDKTVEVLAGDMAKGYWTLEDARFVREGEKTVPLLNCIKEIKIRIKHKVSNLDAIDKIPVGQIIGTLIGMALGPFGALGGKAFGAAVGGIEFICIGLELKDGGRIIMRMRGSVLEKLKKLKANEIV